MHPLSSKSSGCALIFGPLHRGATWELGTAVDSSLSFSGMADFLPVSIRYPNYEQLWLASVVTSNSTTWDPGQFVSAAKPPPTACRPRTVPPASGKLQRCSIVDRLFSLLHVAMSGQEWLKAEDPKVHINNSALSSPLITAKPGCPDRKEAGCPPPSYHHLNRSPKQNEK